MVATLPLRGVSSIRVPGGVARATATRCSSLDRRGFARRADAAAAAASDGRRANPSRRARVAAASSGDASANATSTDANGSTVDPPTSRYARTCADPGAKPPPEDVVGDPDDRRPRGDIRGVRWASSRVLALDAADPGWWTFPPPTPTGAWRTADWRARVPAHLHLPPAPPQLLSVAPMMDYTTPHFRVLCRLLSRRTWLYTEMEVDQTLVHTDHPRLDRFLDFPLSTHPSVLQLGGSDPETLARATAVAAPYGYDEINLNCGCPSPKVAGKGSFGAAMMLEPTLVAECVAAMAENAGGAPVTVKCRIGVDDVDSYEDARRFVEVVAPALPPAPSAGGRPLFAVHARKALLDGLSPAENRTVPPLRHEWVHALARDFPDVGFALNGGVTTLAEAAAIARGDGAEAYEGREFGRADEGRELEALPRGALVGCMVGRAAHADPWGVLATADTDVFGEATNPRASRRELLARYAEYADAAAGRHGITKDGYAVPSLRHLMHPLQNVFAGEPNAKRWRREVDETLKRVGRDPSATVASVLDATLGVLSDETLDAPPKRAARSEDGSFANARRTLGDAPRGRDRAGAPRADPAREAAR